MTIWKNKFAFVLGAVLLAALTFGIANANVIIPPDSILSQINSWTGAQTFNSGNLKLKGSSTGVTTLNSGLSGAGNSTLTLPITASDTLAALGTSETFTAAQVFNANVTIGNGASFTHGSNVTAAFGTTGVDLVGTAFTQTDSVTGAGTVAAVYGSAFPVVTFATSSNAITGTKTAAVYFPQPTAGAHYTCTTSCWSYAADNGIIGGTTFGTAGTMVLASGASVSLGSNADTRTAPSACTESPSGTCSFTTTNGTAEFKITLASSGSATSISWTMPAATVEWTCSGGDSTTTTERLNQTSWGTSSVTMTYYNAAGTATSPGATDVLHIMCRGG